MPKVGQFQLLEWVNCGGGLVASEWILRKAAAHSNFTWLHCVFPGGAQLRRLGGVAGDDPRFKKWEKRAGGCPDGCCWAAIGVKA